MREVHMQRHSGDNQPDAFFAQGIRVQPAHGTHPFDRDVREFPVQLAGQEAAGRHPHGADNHCVQSPPGLLALFEHGAKVHGEEPGFLI